jgi:hypothetical protein
MHERTKNRIHSDSEEGSYVAPNHLPEYLVKGKDVKIMARFRCRNEELALIKWITENRCRICGTEEETIEHLITTCCPTELSEEEILNEDGRGLSWMRGVLECRNLFVD